MWRVRCFSVFFAFFLCLLSWHLTDAIYTTRYYRSYTQSSLARYHRAYLTKDLGPFNSYQSRYSYYSRLSYYYIRTTWSSTRKCGNFEANSYGDYIGFFNCPLSFEWRNATYCCGQRASHYCCDDSSKDTKYTSDPYDSDNAIFIWSWYYYIGIIVGCLFGIGVLTGIIYGVAICCGVAKRKTTSHNRVNAAVISNSNAYPVQPGSGGQPIPIGSYPGQAQPIQPPAYTVAPPPAYPGVPPPPYPPSAVPPQPANDPAYPPPAAYQTAAPGV